MDIRQPNPTQAAGILRGFLKELGVDIKHMAALEAVARVNGFTDWQAMAAAGERASPQQGDAQLVLDADGEGYTFVASRERQRVWITIGNISAYIGPTDEGVVVDLFAKDTEDGGSLTSTYLHFQEALDELCTSLDVDEKDVATWYDAGPEAKYAELSPERKAEVIRDFDKRARVKAAAPRYVHGEWEHFFEGRRVRFVRFVFDRSARKVIALQLQDTETWTAAGRSYCDDLEDSLLHANQEALERPQDEGLAESDELPEWARQTPAM